MKQNTAKTYAAHARECGVSFDDAVRIIEIILLGLENNRSRAKIVRDIEGWVDVPKALVNHAFEMIKK